MVSIRYGTSVTIVKRSTKYYVFDEPMSRISLDMDTIVKKHTYTEFGLQKKAIWHSRVMGKYVIHQVSFLLFKNVQQDHRSQPLVT